MEALEDHLEVPLSVHAGVLDHFVQAKVTEQLDCVVQRMSVIWIGVSDAPCQVVIKQHPYEVLWVSTQNMTHQNSYSKNVS